MTIQHPTSYDLGQHTLELVEEQAITIGDETLAVHLERDEAYRLHLVLADLFHRPDDPMNAKVSHATRFSYQKGL